MPSEVSESRAGEPAGAEAAFAAASTAFAGDSAGSNGGSGNGQGGPFGGSDVIPGAGAFPSVPSASDIDVAPDKVADVARIIDAQADALDKKLSEHLSSLRIQAPAEDIVSQHAVEAWNDVVSAPEDSYAAHARAYVEDLRSLATQLRKAGERYSESDEEKADALGGGRGLPG
ncbi:hypothetical protein FB384_001865 [Prauserella sediminis]|uniref:PE domain-containing protein n=1 Tax=Prauserella sediminis TaxID=577680 RepID=A0A839XJN8_9PSEU|nr:hypothetical protein [Prauserella sediminis]MBB3662961.1 hypothetical protein [Prauserella sediminis]